MSLRQKRLFEEVQQYGIGHLSDADLLLALCSKGTAKEREQALLSIKKLLTERGLTGILKMDRGELLQHTLDEALAIHLLVLLELARRLAQPPQKGYQIKTLGDVVDLVAADMRYLDHEELRVLCLDTRNYVVANLCLYKGTVNSSVLRTAEIFLPAISRKCPSIIIVHNHPSGDPTPSPEDREVTSQCVEAGKLLDIDLLDHVIIGNPGAISLKMIMNW